MRALIFISIVFSLPAAFPLECPAQQQPTVWFGANMASVDMLDLFTSPEEWATARSKIDVFKFSGPQVGSGGWSCDINPAHVCGDNYLANFIAVDAFARIQQWGLDLVIESFFAGPLVSVDPVECATSTHVHNLTLNGSINVIQNVQANGGIVKYLAMDEPLRQWLPAYYYIFTGQTDPRPCLADSLGEIADHVAAYMLQMQAWFPAIPIGHTELYPELDIARLKEWVLALEARGVSIPFLHLDVNGPRMDQYNSLGISVDLAADLLELEMFLEPRGIDLGVIFTDIYWNSQLWEPGTYTDQTYYDGTMSWVNQVDSIGVEIDHRLFQSWVWPYYTTGPGPKEVPINLPDDDPAVYSHTRLVRDASGVVVAVEEPENLPGAIRLAQNTPNPFNPSTTIRFTLSRAGPASLTIHDTIGREVATLVNGELDAGELAYTWNGRDDVGNEVRSGIYFARLRAGDFSATRKMILLR